MARTKRTERSAPDPPPQLQPGVGPPQLQPDPPPLGASTGHASQLPPSPPPPPAAAASANSSARAAKRSRKSRSTTSAARHDANASPKRRKYNYTADKNKPFCCDHCTPKLYFGRKHDLKRHMDTKHLNDRPYQCPRPGCGHASNRRDHARRHLKNHPVCADYVREHHATDATVVAALERAYGGGDGSGSDAWMADLEIDVVAGGSSLSVAAAGTVGSRDISRDAFGQARGGEGDSSDDDQDQPDVLSTMPMAASAGAGAGATTELPDPQLFLAALAAESPHQAPLHSPFAPTSASASARPIDPTPFASTQQRPAGPSSPPTLPPNMTSHSTAIPPYQVLAPLPFYHGNTQGLLTNPPAIATPFFAATPPTYQLPNWPVTVANSNPTIQSPNIYHSSPFGLAPTTSSAAGSSTDPSPWIESASLRRM